MNSNSRPFNFPCRCSVVPSELSKRHEIDIRAVGHGLSLYVDIFILSLSTVKIKVFSTRITIAEILLSRFLVLNLIFLAVINASAAVILFEQTPEKISDSVTQYTVVAEL